MYRTGLWKYQGFLLGGDALILLGAFTMGMEYWWLKAGPDSGDFFPSVFLSLVSYLLGLAAFDLYEIHTNYRTHKALTMTRVVSAVLVAGLGLSGLFYLFPGVKFPRGVFFIQMLLAIPLLFFWRINFWRLRQELLVPKRVLIVGAGEAGRAALGILQHFGSEYVIVGFVDDDPAKRTRPIGNYDVLGSSKDLVSLARNYGVHGIVVAIAGQKQERLIQATLQCRMEGVFVSDLLTLGEELTGRILLEYARGSWFVFAPGFLILHHQAFQRVKRLTDIACAMAGFILASPILLVAALLIKLESRGPVFFLQTRVGQNEQLFEAVKLRTMAIGSDARSPYTAERDPRITRVGRILRFLRIDEIPQMWNVLKGEMSFIGPRAEWDILVNEYKEKIPYYSVRHVVKPGITGWAQVNYPYGRSLGDAVRKLEFDLYYAKNMSMALDLRILFRTISVVMLGERWVVKKRIEEQAYYPQG
ncbi:MAG: sugar transferase [Nitrospirae bacterium]|nr:MAG: sugar transferase [Nitrospirota bacterium]